MFKTLLDSYGNDFGFVWNFGKFLIFLKIFEDSTLHGTLSKKFLEKIPQNMFKTRLDIFGNDFRLFCNFEKFSIFLKIFEDSTLHGTLGKNFSKKIPQNMFKTRLDIFGNDFRLFCNFEKFSIFLKFFEDSTHQGTLGKKIFRNNYPETCSKHVWTVMGTILGLFGILENFWFFWKFSKTRPSMEHWAENFSKKIPQNMFKTRLDIFGNDFRLFCNFEKFSNFLNIFEDSTLHGTLGKNFSKKNPKTCSKHVWTFLGTILDFSAILKNFRFFWKFSKTRPSMEHWAKKFSEKVLQNMFKTRLDIFGNDFRLFCNFEKFLIFLKIFDNSTL